MALVSDFDSRTLRHALGRFATGVTIITTVDDHGQPVGLTANSFNSLSLDPPLVLWSLRVSSPSLPVFESSARFAVNVLGEAQLELSRRFASAVDDKFSDGPWGAGDGGVPVLAGCAAVFECERVSQQRAGDHVLFVGRVLALSEAAVPPLLFQAGHYRMLGEVL
ncbi:MAG: flavin reductase family protein [Rubrivivax sp.]|nr:flavin reductase family protein [Rubrivivax sp.]